MLADYADKYRCARRERQAGVFKVTLHTGKGPLRRGFEPHAELPQLFHDIGADRDNGVIILAGTGAEFLGPRADPATSSFPARPSIERIDCIHGKAATC